MIKNLSIGAILVLLMCGCTLEKKTHLAEEANINEDIEMLSYVFEGNYSTTVIKESMDILFIKYHIKPERHNYLRIGNTLINYRKGSNGQFEEMDIINEMIIVSSLNKQISFDEQLAQSVKKFQEKM